MNRSKLFACCFTIICLDLFDYYIQRYHFVVSLSWLQPVKFEMRFRASSYMYIYTYHKSINKCVPLYSL